MESRQVDEEGSSHFSDRMSTIGTKGSESVCWVGGPYGTLSSLTLLEEEPWPPFFGGILFFPVKYGGLDYPRSGSSGMVLMRGEVEAAEFHKNPVKIQTVQVQDILPYL